MHVGRVWASGGDSDGEAGSAPAISRFAGECGVSWLDAVGVGGWTAVWRGGFADTTTVRRSHPATSAAITRSDGGDVPGGRACSSAAVGSPKMAGPRCSRLSRRTFADGTASTADSLLCTASWSRADQSSNQVMRTEQPCGANRYVLWNFIWFVDSWFIFLLIGWCVSADLCGAWYAVRGINVQ